MLNFVYVGMEISVISLFQAELVPAESKSTAGVFLSEDGLLLTSFYRPVRGFVVGSYQLSIAAGGLVMSCVAKGVSTIASPYAWRIIFACYYFVPVRNICQPPTRNILFSDIFFSHRLLSPARSGSSPSLRAGAP